MKRKVFLDADGVLLDYTQGLWAWAKRKKLLTQSGRQLLTTSGKVNPPDWQIDGHFVGGFAAMADFYRTNEYAYLKPLVRPHFLQAIKSAGADIIVVTAAPSDPTLARARILNLTLHYGDVFDEVIFTKDCKVQVIDQYRGTPFAFVEDKPSTLRAAYEGAPVSWTHPVREVKLPVLGITWNYNRHLIEECPDLPMFTNTEWACAHIIESLVKGCDQAGPVE